MWERRMAGDRRPRPLGFWDDFEAALEEARRALASGAGATYTLFGSGSWWGFASYDPRPGMGPEVRPEHLPHDVEDVLRGALQGVGWTAQRFVQEIVAQVNQAADWATLNRIAEPLLGRYSLYAGMLCGLGESLAGDVRNLLVLAKLIVLAGLYERLKHPSLSRYADPLSLALYVAMNSTPWLAKQAKQADEQLGTMLDEMLEIGRHPVQLIEMVGKSAWKGAASDWSHLQGYAGRPSVRHNFEAGRILGRALYQVVTTLLLVLSVAGVAAKLAARCPALLRLARLISRGGALEELEEVERIGQGARAAEEAEKAPKPRPKPEPERPENRGGSRSLRSKQAVLGQSDGGPGKWVEAPRRSRGVEYQEQISGVERGAEYEVNGVKFDKYDAQRDVLIDAKDWPGILQNADPPGSLRVGWPLKESILDQAKRQMKATTLPIEWHVSDPTATNAVGKLLSDENIPINVIFTPKN